MERKNRVGETNFNFYGNKMTIIEYHRNDNLIVEFEDGYKTKTAYKEFINVIVKNPYDKSVYNHGYLGEGKYKTKIGNKKTIQYDCWNHMLERCYSEKYHIKQPSYRDVTVCEEWLCFQNFAKWFDENYYEIDNERMELDKDILCKGNKEYNPNNCIFVSTRINSLFIKQQRKRGEYPLGIFYNRVNKKYQSQCNTNDKNNSYIGEYDTIEEAFYSYKNYKELYIKQVTDQYKNKIPKKLYDAMYRYKIEIND